MAFGKASPEAIRAAAEEHGYDLSTPGGRARAGRVAQGLPPTIEDKAVLAAVERISRPKSSVRQTGRIG